MAEYSLAAVINMERNFSLAARSQAACEWNTSAELHNYRSLAELKVGILGVGQMGRCAAKIFKGLGCEVWGLVSSPRPACPPVDRYCSPTQLGDLLEAADYIVNLLPATPATRGLLAGDALSRCRAAGLVNIGRGSVCPESDLLAALEAGWLRAATLDVFTEEPLPAASQLWGHPRVTISPHCAGVSRPQDIADCFLRNLQRWDGGEEPDCLVNWDKCY